MRSAYGRSGEMVGTSDKNNEVLKALVGNIEWIYTHPLFDVPRIVFRRDGELHGFCIREIELGAYYGPHGKVNNYPGLNETVFEPLDRKEVLELVMYLKGTALFTEAEKAEWDTYCEAEHKRLAEIREKTTADELRRKRQQLAELKRELGD